MEPRSENSPSKLAKSEALLATASFEPTEMRSASEAARVPSIVNDAPGTVMPQVAGVVLSGQKPPGEI